MLLEKIPDLANVAAGVLVFGPLSWEGFCPPGWWSREHSYGFC